MADLTQELIDKYNAIVQPCVDLYAGYNNGWFVLPVLCGGTTLLSTWLMAARPAPGGQRCRLQQDDDVSDAGYDVLLQLEYERGVRPLLDGQQRDLDDYDVLYQQKHRDARCSGRGEKIMRSMEFSGRTVDEAIFHGLTEMGVTIDEVEIETLQSETKGLFGLGSKLAVVRLTEREVPVVPDMEQYRQREEEAPRAPRQERGERGGRGRTRQGPRRGSQPWRTPGAAGAGCGAGSV